MRHSMIEMCHGYDFAWLITRNPVLFASLFASYVQNPEPALAVDLERFGLRVMLGSYNPEQVDVSISSEAQARGNR